MGTKLTSSISTRSKNAHGSQFAYHFDRYFTGIFKKALNKNINNDRSGSRESEA
jgi:hypothetical protein